MKLPESIKGPRLLRPRDLEAAGMSMEDVAAALKEDLLFRPSLTENSEYALYATAESLFEPDLPDAIIAFLSEGQAIYHRQYASMRHGLTTSLPPTEILLPFTTRMKDRPGIVVTRTRRQAALNEGVDSIPTSFGIPFKITSRARTVVDLMRIKERDGDEWRHGIDALRTYLDEGGDKTELIRLSKLFESWLHPVMDAAIQAYDRTGYAP